jgi:uncharacterized membrane protein YkoI
MNLSILKLKGMKGTMLFITAASFSVASCSQDIPAAKVPAIVQNTIQAKFSNAGKVEWEKKKGVYEAEFDINSTEYTVHVDSAGTLMMYKLDIKETELPAAVMASISREHSGYTIDDAEKLEKDGVIYYQVELEATGKKDVKIVFNPDGSMAPQHISITNI